MEAWRYDRRDLGDYRRWWLWSAEPCGQPETRAGARMPLGMGTWALWTYSDAAADEFVVAFGGIFRSRNAV